jgi:DHA1 family bicyclomycin/chloramphenicol resistance-like MFS transporter
VWGLGAAAPRTLSLAIVRDRYEGDAMARLMSLIMSVFMLVPVVAPGLGAALIRIAPWPIVFWFPAICGAALIVWIRRLPETHAAAHRRPFTWRAVGLGARELATHRQSASFTLATMFLFGVMVSYLTGFELVIEDAYGLGEWFPLLFGIIATVLALSSLNNARLVARLGVRELVRRMAITGVATSALIVVVSSVRGGHPPVWLLVLVLCVGLPLSHGLTPNCNTMALTPLPHVAGTASAIMATVTTAGGSVLASVATGAYDGTTRPLGLSIATYFTLAAVLIVWGSARTGGAAPHDWVAVVERHSSGGAMAGTGDAAPGR